MPTAKIEPNYKISIPKEDREVLHLEIGQEVEVIFRNVKPPTTYTPTASELRAIQKGREEIRRGEHLTIDELFQHLDVERNHTKARTKNSKAHFTTRTRTATRRA